jgi:hypothetical protein
MSKKYLPFGSLLAVIGVALPVLLLLAAMGAPAAQALPPRETPTPDQVARADEVDDGEPAGAAIVLQVNGGLPPNGWGVVQWIDSDGNWHDVEGWRGPVTANGRWWVAPKDFNTGPFRWQIRDGLEGEALAGSDPFTLPGGGNQVLVVPVVMP